MSKLHGNKFVKTINFSPMYFWWRYARISLEIAFVYRSVIYLNMSFVQFIQFYVIRYQQIPSKIISYSTYPHFSAIILNTNWNIMYINLLYFALNLIYALNLNTPCYETHLHHVLIIKKQEPNVSASVLSDDTHDPN